MRILVADDHALFREGLRYILKDLSQSIEIVEAETFDEAVRAAETVDGIDVVLLDLSMPGMSGLSTVREMKSRFPDLRLVVLSASEERADVRQALRFGAKGYIPKSSSRDVMVSALRLVLSGGTYLPPFLLEAEGDGDSSSHASNSSDLNGGGHDGLTPRQLEVLRCLAEGKSNKEIARELGLAEGTVKIHIAGILKALKVSNRTQAVIAAGRLGIAPHH